ncbi:glyoxalase [Actinorhabdospora filicis]|uniref:Glyoxalase n=1 Tax=Actinorhabdospora filicis TaxID=1785913 RepID=A0A9W6W9L2_9ACTN|nr:VOC family protein [Actinorhabdospora filicis]GLZ78754.1 glyoxalase [Actinorhabdospora filicis]
MSYGIDHVQLAIPAGGEEAARPFYARILGLRELVKPPALAVRGGAWYRGPGDEGIELHLGVEADFVPARKAHPGLLWADLDGLAARLEAGGFEVTWDNESIPGRRRFHTFDPFGNRLEFLAPA